LRDQHLQHITSTTVVTAVIVLNHRLHLDVTAEELLVLAGVHGFFLHKFANLGGTDATAAASVPAP
jgi:hypothetical protein